MKLLYYHALVLLVAVIPAIAVEIATMSFEQALSFYLMFIIGILLVIHERLVRIDRTVVDHEDSADVPTNGGDT